MVSKTFPRKWLKPWPESGLDCLHVPNSLGSGDWLELGCAGHVDLPGMTPLASATVSLGGVKQLISVHPSPPTWQPPHSVEFEGFVGLDIRAIRDQICNTFGPKVNHVRQVDF